MPEHATGETNIGQTRGPNEWLHARCVACGADNDRGLHLDFTQAPDGSVSGSFNCASDYEGYPGIVHGGIVSLLLDSAMTHCLFARDEIALTAELTVRMQKPVLVGHDAMVHAHVARSRGRFHILNAEIVQDGETKATAHAKFMRPNPDPTPR